MWRHAWSWTSRGAEAKKQRSGVGQRVAVTDAEEKANDTFVLNSGCSSQKACLYEIGGTFPNNPLTCLSEGRDEWGDDTAATVVKNSSRIVQKEQLTVSSREQVVWDLPTTSWSGKAASDIDALGHRVVRSGPQIEAPVVITPEAHSAIPSLSAVPPLCACHELEGMKSVENCLGEQEHEDETP